MENINNEFLFKEMQALKEQGIPDEKNYAREQLINNNYKLAEFIVRKYFGLNDNIDDLISIGTIALVSAVDTFDVSQGIKFSSYADDVIKNKINVYYQVNNYDKRIIDKYTISINTPVAGKDDKRELTLEGILADESTSNVQELVVKKDEIKNLYSQLTHLTIDEQLMLVYRFGLYNNNRLSNITICKRSGLKVHEGRGFFKKAIFKLRELIAKNNVCSDYEYCEYPIVRNFDDYFKYSSMYQNFLPYTKIFNANVISLKELKKSLQYLNPMEQFALCSTYQIYNQAEAWFDPTIISKEDLHYHLSSAKKSLVNLIIEKKTKKGNYKLLKTYPLIKSQKDILAYLNKNNIKYGETYEK